MGRVGIRELAAELGMSISTVSRAMNARGDVSAATTERVRSAAERLGYQPNQSGRTLRRGATGTVALVMQTNTARTEMGETFYFSVSNGLQQVLAAQSMDLVLLPIGPTKDPYEYLVNAVDRHIADAYVISNTHRVDPRVDLLTQRGVPFVALGRGGSAAHAWLDLDFEGVAAESVKRLADAGHRRIALAFDDGGVNSTSEYARGYRRALAERGLQPAAEIRLPDTPGGWCATRRTPAGHVTRADGGDAGAGDARIGALPSARRGRSSARHRSGRDRIPPEPGVRVPGAVAYQLRGVAGGLRPSARRDRARLRRIDIETRPRRSGR